jgi:hypothetical protein
MFELATAAAAAAVTHTAATALRSHAAAVDWHFGFKPRCELMVVQPHLQSSILGG